MSERMRNTKPEDLCWRTHDWEDGESHARTLRVFSKEIPSGPLLGLGAGSGDGELGMATSLGVSEVVLVDIQPRRIAELPEIEVDYIATDMFDFLEKAGKDDRQYAVVTALAIEYEIDSSRNWNMFWDGLGKIVRKDGLVFVSPSPYSHSYNTFDFDRLSDFDGGSLIVVRK